MSAKRDDGGPAFPVDGYVNRIDEAGYTRRVIERMGGMTLRDYFAAKAMQGELAAMQDAEGEVCGVALDATDETLARLAKHYYRLANAMLKERSK